MDNYTDEDVTIKQTSSVKLQKYDLNETLVKNKKLRHIAKRIMYSRIALVFLLLLAQILILYFSLLNLNKNFEIYLGGSLAISIIFMIYLSNSSGKNEYKLAWMLPLVVFPLFGIAAYLLYHTNISAFRMKRNLAKIKSITSKYHKSDEETQKILEKFPEAAGLARYLITTGCFYPHDDNRISYFKNGEMCAPEILNDIQQAKDFIFLEFFIIDIDSVYLPCFRRDHLDRMNVGLQHRRNRGILLFLQCHSRGHGCFRCRELGNTVLGIRGNGSIPCADLIGCSGGQVCKDKLSVLIRLYPFSPFSIFDTDSVFLAFFSSHQDRYGIAGFSIRGVRRFPPLRHIDRIVVSHGIRQAPDVCFIRGFFLLLPADENSIGSHRIIWFC
ncbi:MAG: PLDc N-terminal domain-containing protein, partial [Treponema sp.]|nr:PLDc N-terminal domain-containing protein [Treponema sp.]